MYGLLLEQYIRDPKERDVLFHAIDTIPCVREWLLVPFMLLVMLLFAPAQGGARASPHAVRPRPRSLPPPPSTSSAACFLQRRRRHGR